MTDVKQQPHLVMICGPNGAGKSTFTKEAAISNAYPVVDADQIAKDKNLGPMEAGKEALKEINSYINDNQSFVRESTLTANYDFKLMQAAKEKGYKVSMVYIGLESKYLSQDRVTQRHSSGGHDVPSEDLERRYEKSVDNLFKATKIADEVKVFDNSGQKRQSVASFENGQLTKQHSDLAWFKNGYTKSQELEKKAKLKKAETKIKDEEHNARVNYSHKDNQELIGTGHRWFAIKIEGHAGFEVYALHGIEKLNQPFVFEVELVSKSGVIDIIDLIGRPALLTMIDTGGQVRKVHGLIKSSQQLHTANIFTHYKISIVPRLWFLDENQNHRIFQKISIVEIINQILKEQNFLTEHVLWHVKEKYETREYCVQYAESDLYFISRLCEEEGLYYYHEHHDDGHYLCFSDTSGGPWVPGTVKGALRYFPGSGQVADMAVILGININQQVNSDASRYQEWNFKKTKLNLDIAAKEGDQRKAPAPSGINLETYQFPHLYDLPKPGTRYTDIQLLRQLTFSKWLDGASNVTSLLPGFAITPYGHPRSEVNGSWWLTEVRHKGEQPQVLEHEAPSERGFFYKNEFVAIPFETRFIPEIKHPKKKVDGLQSAIVTGPGGEEVYVDEYGRVKVHFHWDRLGALDAGSSCWVRVADRWAGCNLGFIQAPRIGQEVIVEFMEGDPDRPVITGRVYNTDRMPPWELPSQKPLSGIQSREFKASKRGQMVFDDSTGQVQGQLSSDHNLSQLNLGHITRIVHGNGRQDFRGEGFELRTDGWGAIRSGKGLLISTDKRPQAESYHKDPAEALNSIKQDSDLHKNLSQTAAAHQAQPDEPSEIAQALDQQADAIKGSGRLKEFKDPQLVFSSPDGLALTTPGNKHIVAGENVSITANNNLSMASGESLVMTALRRISLFAKAAGLKLFAAKEKLEIQAQSDDLDIIAAKVLKIISVKENVLFSAPKEISLSAAGTTVKLNSSGIQSQTGGQFVAYAASHSLIGPKSVEPLNVALPKFDYFDEFFSIVDENNDPIKGLFYKLVSAEEVIEGRTDNLGRTIRFETLESQPVQLFTGRLYAQNEYGSVVSDGTYYGDDSAQDNSDGQNVDGFLLDDFNQGIEDTDIDDNETAVGDQVEEESDDDAPSGNVTHVSPSTSTLDAQIESNTLPTGESQGQTVCLEGRLITEAEGKQIVAEAATWEGTKYLLGGTTKEGADCSGSVYAIYKNAGFPIKHEGSRDFQAYAEKKDPYPRFKEVNTPQEGDIASWNGHMAIYHDFGTTLYHNKQKVPALLWTARTPGKLYSPGAVEWYDDHYKHEVKWYRYYIWPGEELCGK